MVGVLLGLDLALARARLRSSPMQVIGFIILCLYAVGLVVGAFAAMASLAMVGYAVRASVPVLALAGVTVVWIIVSFLFAGVNQTLDPARFSLLSLRARELVPGMTVVAMLGAGPLTCLASGLGLAVAWAPTSLAATVVAVLSGLLSALVGIVATRALAATFAAALNSRRFKDLAGVVIFLLLMGLSMSMQFLPTMLVHDTSDSATLESLQSWLGASAGVLAWTPLGAAWALPGDVARGAWLALLGHFAVAVVTIGLLGWLWVVMLDHALTSPLSTGNAATKVKANHWVDRLMPSTPAGAVGARTLRYWRRDNRHLMGLLALLMMPFFFIVPIMVNSPADGGDGGGLLPLAFAAPLMTLMAGNLLGADLSYDGTSITTHMLTGLRGRDDRLGRLMGNGMLVVPLVLLVMVLGLLVSGRGDLFPAVLGLTCVGLGTSMGLGLLQDVLITYPYPPPGTNPFTKNSNGSPLAVIAIVVEMTVIGLLAVPAIILTALSLDGPTWYGWAALGYGLVVGPLVLWGLLTWSGRLLDRRWDRVLASVRDGKP